MQASLAQLKVHLHRLKTLQRACCLRAALSGNATAAAPHATTGDVINVLPLCLAQLRDVSDKHWTIRRSFASF